LVSRLSSSSCFADVWEATCHMKPVAVKIPKVGTCQDITSWITEMEIMRRNWHPNIALYMGTCVKDGVLMIVMELLHGDLHHLLHETKEELSLFTRMKMCRDVALGMNWLHKTVPTIIHKDLKTSNLLVEKIGTEYRLKVADFGISQIKNQEGTTTRGSEALQFGTLLTTAPEILNGTGDYNEKTDVYSFGLILWEVATRQPLFRSYVERGSVERFIHAICNEHKRPVIPENMLPELRRLMEMCWNSNPNQRPDFDRIIELLDNIIVKSAIRDAHGRSFWIKHFLKKESVPWKDFVEAFYAFLKLNIPIDPDPDFEDGHSYYLYLDTDSLGDLQSDSTTHEPTTDSEQTSEKKTKSKKVKVSDDILNLRCLHALLVKRPTTAPGRRAAPQGEVVSIERFGELLDWFGPIVLHRNRSPSCPILDNIRTLLQEEWFHGDVPVQEAQRLLGKEAGRYLVRFSSNSGCPGCFTISRITSRGQACHIRVMHTNSRFSVADDRDFGSINELIAQLGPALHLDKACKKPSRFRAIFAANEEHNEDSASDGTDD
jgi:serine/threonine protein kinase